MVGSRGTGRQEDSENNIEKKERKLKGSKKGRFGKAG